MSRTRFREFALTWSNGKPDADFTQEQVNYLDNLIDRIVGLAFDDDLEVMDLDLFGAGKYIWEDDE